MCIRDRVGWKVQRSFLVNLVYYFPVLQNPTSDAWRQTHLGRLLAMASARFDTRVLTLMAHNDDLTLALSLIHI